jgi:hypothetical protein
MSKFNVGDKVFHVGYGIGTVTSSYSDFTFGVNVDFDINQRQDTFTADGRLYEEHIMPSLLTLQEARDKGYDVPKEKVKKWRWVYQVSAEYYITEEYLTEKEAKERKGERLVQKIDSTEIEVDE